jgi:hypothetical protein
MNVSERAAELARDVIAPLLLGGPLRADRPFGAKLALELGQAGRILDNDLAVAIDSARLRAARTLVPMDALPPLSAWEWSIAAAFNDLLQVTNHALSGFATRGRHQELLAAVIALSQHIPACATLEEAVCRHATFGRALDVRRVDTRVSWWTGSASFRGQDPPARVLAWPGLRRVDVQRSEVALVDMAEGVAVEADGWLEAVARWLALSPLSDLTRAGRQQPRFVWTRESLRLVASVGGRNLALRALSHAGALDRQQDSRAIEHLTAAAAELPSGSQAQTHALSFVEEAKAAATMWAETQVA